MGQYKKRDDTMSCTVCLDSIFITGVIEAIVNRDIAVIDILGTFLHADLEGKDQVLMVIEGRLAKMMAITDPKIYRKCITTDKKGRKMPLLNCRKHYMDC